MTRLPRRLLAYVWLIALLATVAAAPVMVEIRLPGGTREWLAMLGIPPMLVLALRYPIRLTARRHHDTTATPVIVAAILLPPPLAILVVGLGILAGELTRPTRRGAQVAFNTGAAVLAISVATRFAAHPESLGVNGPLLAAGIAAAIYWAIGNLAMEVIVALQTGQSPFREWRQRNLDAARHEWSLFVIGAIVALVADHEPWALVLLPVPVGVVYRSFLFQQRRVQVAEAGRAEAEGERTRLTAIIEATPDFVATADPSGRVLYLNEAGRGMLGLSAVASLDGISLSATFPGWEGASWAATSGDGWAGESAILVPGKRPVPVSKVVLAHRGPLLVDFLSVVARDITAQKELERSLATLARHDALTGLLNRRALDDELHRLVADPGETGALFFIDLDGFKGVNDRFGHEAGDNMLVGAAAALRETVGDEGTVARLGGDEFAVIARGMSGERAADVALALAAAVAAVAVSVEGQAVSVGASVGFAVFPEDASTAKDLLSRADGAMYSAKKRGQVARRYRDAA